MIYSFEELSTSNKVKRKPYYCDQRQSWMVGLNTGHQVFIDEEDVELISRRTWKGIVQYSGVYAATNHGHSSIRMHRLLVQAPYGLVVDHINGNTLDNRKSNLRICSHRENLQNTKHHRNGKLVGATFDKEKGKWKSCVYFEGKLTHLGYFCSELEAHEAYMKRLEEIKNIAGLK